MAAAGLGGGGAGSGGGKALGAGNESSGSGSSGGGATKLAVCVGIAGWLGGSAGAAVSALAAAAGASLPDDGGFCCCGCSASGLFGPFVGPTSPKSSDATKPGGGACCLAFAGAGAGCGSGLGCSMTSWIGIADGVGKFGRSQVTSASSGSRCNANETSGAGDSERRLGGSSGASASRVGSSCGAGAMSASAAVRSSGWSRSSRGWPVASQARSIVSGRSLRRWPRRSLRGCRASR